MADVVASIADIDDKVLFSPVSARNPFRRRRTAAVVEMMRPIIAAKGSCHVLDVGGTPEYWLLHRDLWQGLPIVFTLLNTYKPVIEDSGFAQRIGDARDMREFADGSIDLVHSNSVIEHVGTWSDMSAMAREVRRVANAYFVQTPYAGFPFEPHFRLPFFQWLPTSVQLSIVMGRKNGYMPRAASVDEAMEQIESAKLVDRRQMRALFPDADVVFERFLGLPKSMMAVRRWSRAAA